MQFFCTVDEFTTDITKWQGLEKQWNFIYPIGIYKTVPTQSDGENGDYALLNGGTKRVYQKKNNSWINVTELMNINNLYVFDGVVYKKESLADDGKFVVDKTLINFNDRINHAGNPIDWSKVNLTITKNGTISDDYYNDVFEIITPASTAANINKTFGGFTQGASVGFLLKCDNPQFPSSKIHIRDENNNDYTEKIYFDIGHSWKFVQCLIPSTIDSSVTMIKIIFDNRDFNTATTFYISDLQVCEYNYPLFYHLYNKNIIDSSKTISDIKETLDEEVIGKTFLEGDYDYITGGAWQYVYKVLPVNLSKKLYYSVGNITYPSSLEWEPRHRIEILSGTTTIENIFIMQNSSGSIDLTQYPTATELRWFFYMTTSESAPEGSQFSFNAVLVYQRSDMQEANYDIQQLQSEISNIDEAISVLPIDWKDKVYSCYGDSITAICNGDFQKPYNTSTINGNWGVRIADYLGMSKMYGRGIGGQTFYWGSDSGSVAWVSPTGEYINRIDGQTYDNWDRTTYPTGVTHQMELDGDAIRIRGCGCSWLRITKMFPETIKDTINVVSISFVNDIAHTAAMGTALSFIENSTDDTEWAASSYYSTYGGDYNIKTSVAGGIASLIMKLQAWMPNCVIVLCTPLGGRGTSGELDPNLSDESVRTLQSVVKETANRLSIPLIDVYSSCGINGLNRTRFISDSVHPYVAAGKMMLARAMIGGLRSILPLMSIT